MRIRVARAAGSRAALAGRTAVWIVVTGVPGSAGLWIGKNETGAEKEDRQGRKQSILHDAFASPVRYTFTPPSQYARRLTRPKTPGRSKRSADQAIPADASAFLISGLGRNPTRFLTGFPSLKMISVGML